MKKALLTVVLLCSPLMAQYSVPSVTGAARSAGAPTEIRRPTVETLNTATSLCGGVNSLTAAPDPNFYDSAGESTFDIVDASSYPTPDLEYMSATYSGFATAGHTYTALKLIVYSQCTASWPGSSMYCGVEYSTNAGTSWTTIFKVNVDRGPVRDSISLSSSQDLTQVKVRYCIAEMKTGEYDDGTALGGFDIRTEGNY